MGHMFCKEKCVALTLLYESYRFSEREKNKNLKHYADVCNI